MKQLKYTLPISTVIIAAIIGVTFQNDLFAAYLWTLEGLAIVVPLTLVVGLIMLGFVLARRRIGKGLRYSMLIGCSLIVSLFAFDSVGTFINRSKVNAVESYVAHAVPILEQIKSKQGAYPSKLPVNLIGNPPELLQLYGDYAATSSTFRFEYIDEPAGWAGGAGYLEFDSDKRQWTYER